MISYIAKHREKTKGAVAVYSPIDLTWYRVPISVSQFAPPPTFAYSINHNFINWCAMTLNLISTMYLKLTKFALKWVLTWRDSFIFKHGNHGKYVKFHFKMKRLHPRAGPSSRHMAIRVCCALSAHQYRLKIVFASPTLNTHCTYALPQGSTLAVARWPGATKKWCRATKLPKKLYFGGPIGQLKFQGDDVMRITSNRAECCRNLIPMLKANSQLFWQQTEPNETIFNF